MRTDPKAQTVIQYMVTYGWMIIIVALAIGLLFYLGVLIPPTGARAPPGACHVLRPNGPGSNQFMELDGVCTGELPEYVLILPSASSINSVVVADPSYFDSLGGSSYSLTIAYWVYGNWPYIYGGGIFIPIVTRKGQFGSCIAGAKHAFELKDGYTNNGPIDDYPFVNDSWYFVTSTVSIANGVNSIILYVNATPQSETNYVGPILWGTDPNPGTSLFIGGQYGSQVGACGGADEVLDGYLSNVQIYNTSLSANDVKELYHEGIGGAPVELPNLVGWWPLNGNLNDYSGNNNNGTMGGVVPTFDNQWLQDTKYVPP